MASTYTTNLGIEKIGSGEQAGAWGNTTNNNFDLIDEAVDSGYSLYPWLRKPKGNKDAKVEMLGLKGFPKMSSLQQQLF